jgi:F-type H+-transporting ATPase subunit gamma
MTRRREIEQRRAKLIEIRDIMHSMRTLAFMETHKLARVLDAQRAVVKSIQAVAADFLAFYPEALPEAPSPTEVYLLIGSERGFCGAFNEALLARLASAAGTSARRPLVVATGRKLHALLDERPDVVARVAGANIAEEVAMVLSRLVAALPALPARPDTLALKVVYHGLTSPEVVVETLLPPFHRPPAAAPSFALPPLLNLPPEQFLLELAEHYLFAALHEALYASLMAENQRRMSHLDAATQHLDEKTAELLRRCNALRQEEVIEEIEVILLSTTGADRPPGR